MPERFDLRLVIQHPSMAPDDIARRLELEPYLRRTTIKGSRAATAAGWSNRFEKRQFLDEVSNLSRILAQHRELFRELRRTGGAAEIVVHLPGDVNIGWTLAFRDLEVLADLQIDLGVEVFPEFT